ncbi:His/Gly/Thr/Pro-type tRNA ligase C-terminal domain-containing protein [Staphylococcus pseudoxylosus]|uniref:His/Gly/Thr/Pro-type tRNA ligase C-terminal domain-containing protein n=1 Tax=Staphylococcus pseudoxylosus TaxID=2282419 RepID=UPI00398B1611
MINHVEQIQKHLKSNGIRVTVDSSDEKIGYKIRQSQITKVPYTIVMGDNEVRDNTLFYSQTW